LDESSESHHKNGNAAARDRIDATVHFDLTSSAWFLLEKENIRPKYVIEREIPGAGKLSAEELKAISQKSCGVLQKLGPQIQWVHSYVTDDKVYCVYSAPNEEMVREHATQGGFPADRISQVRSIIDPTTAEQ
jgi:hypothetical protein